MNRPEFTHSNSCFWSFHGFSSSSAAHCVMTYAHPRLLASVKRHACKRRSRYDDVMVSSRAFLIDSQALLWVSFYPASFSDMRLAVVILRLFFPFSDSATNLLSTVDASENNSRSRHIHPVAALNCHTCPTFSGGDTALSPCSLSGSTVIPCRVTR